MKITLLTTARKWLTTSTILRIPQKLSTPFEEIATCDDANHFNFLGSIDYQPHTVPIFCRANPRKSLLPAIFYVEKTHTFIIVYSQTNVQRSYKNRYIEVYIVNLLNSDQWSSTDFQTLIFIGIEG